MKWGLDGAYPPTLTQAMDYRSYGYSWFAGYMGGRAAHVWTPTEWHTIVLAGFEVLPIWVAPLVDDAGRQAGVDDGNAAIDALERLGFGGVVCLDIENGLTPVEYAEGFIDAAHNGFVNVVVYGLPATLEQVPNAEAWWLAFWPGSPHPMQGAPPDWTYWQFASGDLVDFSVASDQALFATVRLD